MLSKNIAQEVLAKCLATGGDFAEIFEDDSINNSISLIDGRVENAIGGRTYGIGIRIFKGLKSVYAYTNNNSLDSLLETAYSAALALGEIKEDKSIILNESKITTIHPIIYYPKDVAYEKRISILKSGYGAAKNYSDDISQVVANYSDKQQHILIANTEGLYIEDTRVRTRLGISAIASKENENQTGFEGPGAHKGIELFDTIDPEYYGKEAARVATTLLYAKNCPAGNMAVAIDNGFGGVIFHEACGHALEASSVSKGNSVFANKLGQQIASTKVTAIDDGTIPNAWGSLNVDDEGNKTQKNVLIENGILKGYMIDKLNGRRMNMEATGSSRRQSYKYQPTSRMTNTYIAAGTDKAEDIIKSISDGLYAKKLGGGSVNPVTGEFNFSVQEGYLVKNGIIQEPVRGASLIGKGSEVLMDIDMVGDNLKLAQGVCGASSGNIPTNVGQPMIRVKKMTVGGR
ncbi:TldD/PmbA family protein [Clostridium saccharobutylicum]|uniref:Protein TldD n=1 Tax=Clostridium saccharobutylicum DSM 13864 TaxID=1345695 RepID=U5ML29_CLOSA|nr:TldD/PmbA family protein [Clostridium saccharobutylicum]AGX41489.1 protein TldD [Clostridium saccharobutylicum DSM 13864]AQR88769.1 metalloprotease TldD [Clostridium saccharobutylicum]AQR98667.1 metalloprotease TldD [Clostridium saccharobutylicum]AQS08391.1 metalloprotease TldD [Clostridium saccharobutylicum]AQS12657.1 metalloprotease TldD [Clostridium saccharobutylicum]